MDDTAQTDLGNEGVINHTGRKKGKLGKTRVALAIFLCVPLLVTSIAATTVRFTGGRILDDTAFASYSANAINDPTVADAIGKVVGDKVLDVVDENHQKDEKARDAIKSAAATVLESPESKKIAADVFAKTHADFLATAERNDLTGKETMIVNFTPLVYRAFVAVADSKQVRLRAPLPSADSLSDDAAMLSALSKSLGVKLKEKTGTVKVIEQKEDGSDTAFVQVHDVLNAYHNGVNAATAVALVLAALVIALFVRRRIGVIVASSVVLVGTIAPWIALAQVPTKVQDSIDNAEGKAVARAFLDPLTGDVRSRLLVVIVLCIVAILVASLWRRVAGLVGRKSTVA